MVCLGFGGINVGWFAWPWRGSCNGADGSKGISPYFSYSEDGVETINLSYGPREGSGILRICRLYICTLSYQESLLRILMPNMWNLKKVCRFLLSRSWGHQVLIEIQNGWITDWDQRISAAKHCQRLEQFFRGYCVETWKVSAGCKKWENGRVSHTSSSWKSRLFFWPSKSNWIRFNFIATYPMG